MKNSWACRCWKVCWCTPELSLLCNRAALQPGCQLFCGVWLKLLLYWCRSHKPALSNTNDSLYGYQASGTTGENRRRSWWGLFTGRSSLSLLFNFIFACWHAVYHVTTLKSAVDHCQNLSFRWFTSWNTLHTLTVKVTMGVIGYDKLKSWTHTCFFFFSIKCRPCAFNRSYLVLDSNFECFRDLPSVELHVTLIDGWIWPNNHLEEFNYHIHVSSSACLIVSIIIIIIIVIIVVVVIAIKRNYPSAVLCLSQ